jgi:sulfate permease, SulP family
MTSADRSPGAQTHWSSEVVGATHAAFIALPLCLAYGLLAFAPLGASWALYGATGGIIAAVVAPTLATLFGVRSGLIYVPRPMGAIVMASFLAEFSQIPEVSRAPPALIMVAGAMFVALMGAIEGLFGVLRVGRLAKFLPAPVVAGFQCGAALVLIQTQWRTLLGVDPGQSFMATLTGQASMQPMTVAIALICLGTAVFMTRRAPSWPVFAVVLLTAALLQWAGSMSGVVVSAPLGTFNLQAADPTRIFKAFDQVSWSLLETHLPFIASWALTGAVMSAAGALVGFKMIEEAAQQRLDMDSEMTRTGLANVLGALVGGLHAGAHVRSTETNLQYGGRRGLSTMLAALWVLSVTIVFSPVIGQIPKAAVASVLIVIAVSMFDPWTLQVIKQSIRERTRPTADVVSMISTVLVVTGLAVMTNLLIAMIGGIFLAIVSFIWRMSRSIIKRSYTLRDIQSRTIRSPDARARVLEKGQRVRVFELEGPLFFGTGEKLIDVLSALSAQETDVAIVDMQRLTDIDSTAVRLLAQIDKRLDRQGITLVFSGSRPHDRVYRLLEDFGMAMVVVHHGAYIARMFNDVDQALEWAEERLLADTDADMVIESKYALDTLDMFRGFTVDELRVVQKHLVARHYGEGDIVFRAGDTSREIFAIAEGRASVSLPASTPDGSATRLVTFSSGAVFGEFALLDNQPRSATVRADTPLDCWILSLEEFDRLRLEQPICAIKLLANLGRELSMRLRGANQTIRVLAP